MQDRLSNLAGGGGATKGRFRDRQFTVYRRISTNQQIQQVFAAVEESLRFTVGGIIHRNGDTIDVENGTNDLGFSVLGNVVAAISLTQPSAGIVDIQGVITVRPSTMGVLCFVAGFVFPPTWIGCVLFFLINPQSNYQSAIDRVHLTLSVPPADKGI